MKGRSEQVPNKNIKKILLLIKYELTMKYKIYKSLKNRSVE